MMTTRGLKQAARRRGVPLKPFARRYAGIKSRLGRSCKAWLERKGCARG